MDDSSDLPSSAAIRVAVSQLILTAFRNYERLEVNFDGRMVVLAGPNGAGKTNLMEAVSFLSPGRGLRRASLDAVARTPGNGTWAIAARVARAEAPPVSVGTGVAMSPTGPERRRTVRIEREPARNADALLGILNVMWLTPAMDGLFTGPAADRRAFIDRAVLAIDRDHGRRANAFERAVRNRNRLIGEPPFDARVASAIETEIAGLGVAIAAARRQWCDLTCAVIAETDDAGPFPAARIALSGFLEERLTDESASAVEDAYRERLEAGRPRDAAAGRTLTGPHRSDLGVVHAPKEIAAAMCSTGEQKALLIGLVLSQARLASRLAGMTPVVLLDEIAAHLDESRREALYDRLDALGCQAFMTGTDMSVFDALGARAERFAVSDAAIVPA